MLETLMINNVWLAVVIWCVLYISDYALTIYGARLYRRGAKEHLVLSGSYEMTEYFQKDIDGLRTVSSRFILALVLYVGFILIEWVFTVQWARVPQLFSLLVGGLILLEFAVHVRHVRNITSFSLMQSSNAVQGTIAYSRPFSLKMSAVEFLTFGFLYLAFAVFTGSWLFLGGAVSCLGLGARHWIRANRAMPAVVSSAEQTATNTLA